jgi:hypothetical protein
VKKFLKGNYQMPKMESRQIQKFLADLKNLSRREAPTDALCLEEAEKLSEVETPRSIPPLEAEIWYQNT